ncbi:MAG: SDR family oxidoreductase [Proteobacteria bacterium]|nr:SDR family oxidoreductase [Pseudomonadota bacterium]
MHTRLNPVALVTGAAHGIGAACARSLATHASGGLIMVDADEKALSAAADALPSPPERVSTLAFDSTNAEAWKRAQDFIRGQYGRVDWTVAAVDAGMSAAETLLRATLGVANAVTPLMKGNMQGGAIVLALAAHSAKVDALLQLVRVPAKEGAAHKVRVNAVINGATESPLWRRDPEFATLLKEVGDEIGVLNRIAKGSIPLVRCSANQDVLRLVRLLLSDDSAVSGATLAVDGGTPL